MKLTTALLALFTAAPAFADAPLVAGKPIAIILANYPDKDGRVANGVGYDTPASTIEIFKALSASGYKIDNIPASGNSLISSLLSSRRVIPAKAGTGSRLQAGGDVESLDSLDSQTKCNTLIRFCGRMKINSPKYDFILDIGIVLY